jgi:hypothetical protein
LLLVGVRNTKIQHLVESTGTQQCRIQQIRPVGRSNDKHASGILSARHAVQLSQQLRHDTIHDTAAISLVASLGRHGIQLVEEDDAGARVAGALEDAPHVGFGLTNVHVEQLWALDAEEVEAVLGGDGLCEQGLSRAGGTVEEDAGTLLHALCEELGAL